MEIAIASDHGGYCLKNEIIRVINELGYDYHDFGTFSLESVDYPDYALQVAEAVSRGQYARGILCCGTGIGMAIAANKVVGVRAAVCGDTFSARASREHNDANVLALGERVIGAGLARDIVKIWLQTEFAGGRHQRRVEKINSFDFKYQR